MSRLERLSHALTVWHRLPLPLQTAVSCAASHHEKDPLEYIVRVHQAATEAGISTAPPALKRHVVLTALRTNHRLQ